MNATLTAEAEDHRRAPGGPLLSADQPTSAPQPEVLTRPASSIARRFGVGRPLLVLIVAWIVLWILFRDHTPSRLATSELAPSHQWLNDLRDRVNASRADNLLFTVVFDPLRAAVDRLAVGLQSLISQPALDRPVPIIGWFGVLALVMLLGHAVSGWRMATLCGAGFACFGLLGLWQESMDTLAMTLAAVLICIVIGIPIGVLCARSRRIERCVTPVCDFLQTMPTFVYLAPLTLIFLIGPASAVIATLLYALPPVIRITAHGMAGVPVTVAEAGTSLGATDWQLLRKVQLPMAARMIVTGINQTTMCALSMVTIAALIDAPGLGRTVMQALVTLDVGAAFTGGLAIVILAVVLDRLTTAAGVRVDTRRRQRTRAARRTRHRLLGCLGLLTTGAVYLSYTFVWAAVFPGQERHGLLGRHVIAWVNTANEWVKNHLSEATDGIKDLMTYGALNPLESVIADSPWYLTGTVVLLLAWIVAGVRAGVIAGCCLGLLQATGLWYEAMVTLTSTLVATSMVMLCGLVLGVWMGRSDRADLLLRPLLDAAQVMPAFVYLVPCLGLFGATRFTAIVAAVVFAAPVSIKLIAEGMRGVCPAAVEAAVSAGATPLQVIAKVQLPLASRSLALAANQGLIYVLSMVVVGGLVGAGALGYLVVAGFSQTSLYGKGLAAGLAIVLLGILLDRTTQAAARRVAATDGRPN